MSAWSQWIPVDELSEKFVRAEFYAPIFLSIDGQIKKLPNEKLSNISKELFQGWSPKGGVKSENGIPAIKVQDLSGYGLSNDFKCADIKKEAVPNRAWAKQDDIFVIRCAHHPRYIGLSVDNFYENEDEVEPFITEKIIVARGVAKKANPGYVTSFLRTKYGYLQIQRRLGGLTANYTPTDFGEIRIPTPSKEIQEYIGLKVEIAEKCRKQATGFKDGAKKQFEELINWNSKYEIPLLSHWVKPDLMESRMDLNFNSPRKIRLLEFLKDAAFQCEQLDSLVNISAMIGWKGLTTEHYVSEGPWLLRGVEYRDGYIDFDALVSVEQYKYDEQPQIHLQHKDIAMTKDGTIGKALVVPRLNKSMAAGSTIARLRIKNGDSINPYFLELVINHPVVQIQIQSFATGLAQPHITQEWIAQLIIPRVEEKEAGISKLVEKHHYLMEMAHNLSKEAKSDVESLIEGKLDTEAILSGKLKAPTWEDIEKELEGI